ncbi:hypothetical protein H0H92_011266 [Tricholoma furcatifolium]|nr:hypothetical protein H0H92_011266 [Tricholoma furcatifolium]
MPSRKEDEVEWKTIDIGSPVVNVGLSLSEHDLIAVLTFDSHSLQPRIKVMQIRLIQFSTGKPHPLAQEPVLTVEESARTMPSAVIGVVGDHLVAILAKNSRDISVHDRLYILEWKTGIVKLDIQPQSRMYSSFTFLSPTILCLPNRWEGTLDIWLIPNAPFDGTSASQFPSIKPFLQFSLPKFSGGHFVLDISCRGEPNPLLHGSPYSSQPFHPTTADAIIIFDISAYCHSHENEYMNTMMVHRRTLLELCLGREKKPDYRPEAMFDSKGAPEGVSWEEWGPQRTRWFLNHNRITGWINITTGQRAVFIEPFDEDEDEDVDTDDPVARVQRITVLDFNQYRVKELTKREGGPNSLLRVVDREYVIRSNHLQDPLLTNLPYVSVEIGIPFDSRPLGGMLMDEERLVGVKLNSQGQITQLEVYHIGSRLAQE